MGSQTADLPTGGLTRSPSARGDHSSRRVLLIWLLAGGSMLAALVICLEVFVARRIPELTEQRLAAAMDRWRGNGPANYDLDVEIRGLRPGIVHIEVRNGEAVAMTRDGRTPPQPRTWEAWTVRGQFEMLEQELIRAEVSAQQNATDVAGRALVRCDFDPQFGYPRQFQRVAYGGQPDVYWRVTDFSAR